MRAANRARSRAGWCRQAALTVCSLRSRERDGGPRARGITHSKHTVCAVPVYGATSAAQARRSAERRACSAHVPVTAGCPCLVDRTDEERLPYCSRINDPLIAVRVRCWGHVASSHLRPRRRVDLWTSLCRFQVSLLRLFFFLPSFTGYHPANGRFKLLRA